MEFEYTYRHTTDESGNFHLRAEAVGEEESTSFTEMYEDVRNERKWTRFYDKLSAVTIGIGVTEMLIILGHSVWVHQLDGDNLKTGLIVALLGGLSYLSSNGIREETESKYQYLRGLAPRSELSANTSAASLTQE